MTVLSIGVRGDVYQQHEQRGHRRSATAQAHGGGGKGPLGGGATSVDPHRYRGATA